MRYKQLPTKKAVSPWRNGLAGIGQFYFYTVPYAGIIQVRFRGCNLRQFLPPLKHKFDNQTLRNRVLDVKDNPTKVSGVRCQVSGVRKQRTDDSLR